MAAAAKGLNDKQKKNISICKHVNENRIEFFCSCFCIFFLSCFGLLISPDQIKYSNCLNTNKTLEIGANNEL